MAYSLSLPTALTEFPCCVAVVANSLSDPGTAVADFLPTLWRQAICYDILHPGPADTELLFTAIKHVPVRGSTAPSLTNLLQAATTSLHSLGVQRLPGQGATGYCYRCGRPP